MLLVFLLIEKQITIGVQKPIVYNIRSKMSNVPLKILSSWPISCNKIKIGMLKNQKLFFKLNSNPLIDRIKNMYEFSQSPSGSEYKNQLGRLLFYCKDVCLSSWIKSL